MGSTGRAGKDAVTLGWLRLLLPWTLDRVRTGNGRRRRSRMVRGMRVAFARVRWMRMSMSMSASRVDVLVEAVLGALFVLSTARLFETVAIRVVLNPLSLLF